MGLPTWDYIRQARRPGIEFGMLNTVTGGRRGGGHSSRFVGQGARSPDSGLCRTPPVHRLSVASRPSCTTVTACSIGRRRPLADVTGPWGRSLDTSENVRGRLAIENGAAGILDPHDLTTARRLPVRSLNIDVASTCLQSSGPACHGVSISVTSAPPFDSTWWHTYPSTRYDAGKYREPSIGGRWRP